MSRTAGSGLARVTIVAPRRRIDVALPAQVPAAELLPSLLRHAGDDLADTGQAHGGWVLRRSDGTMLDPGRTLAAQELPDGEVLHLVPRQDEWPELDYDDVVDAIATGARKQSRSWGGGATRHAGITVATCVLLLSLGIITTTGPPWLVPGLVLLALSVLLLVVAIVLSRAIADAGAGVVIGTVAMLFAATGGVAVFNGDQSLLAADAAQYLSGSTVLLFIALVAYFGVADRTQYFVAGIVVGLLGLTGSLVGLLEKMDTVKVVAILVTVVIAFAPVIPLLSIRLGKLPMPNLPTTPADLLAEPPKIPRPRVYATVRRSDELLTGMLLGTGVIAGVCQIILVASRTTSAIILVTLVALATLLRGRLFPTLRHRVPLLSTGLVGVAALAVGTLVYSPGFRLTVTVPVLLVVAGLVLAAGLVYQNRPPSPYLGRFADIFDVLLVIAVVPVTCAVTGLYGYVRGLYG